MQNNHETPLLNVENLHISFKGENKQWIETVKGISFAIPKNKTVALVGESGSGKSVTSLAVMGLLPKGQSQIAAQSRITFEGKDLLNLSAKEIRKICGKEIAMIFQEPMTSLNPVLRIGDQIAEAIRLHQNLSAKEALARSVGLLDEVGIPQPQRRVRDYPHQMSGGMRQRVMIAMAMSCHPRLLLADEPTTALDVTIQAQILSLISSLKEKNNMAVILTTHDLGVVAEAAQKVAVMYAGKIVETSDVEKLFANPLHPYTRGLIESRPSGCSAADGDARLKTIRGTVPSLYELPSGCRFSERCDLAENICRQAQPELVEIEEGHFAACFVAERAAKN